MRVFEHAHHGHMALGFCSLWVWSIEAGYTVVVVFCFGGLALS